MKKRPGSGRQQLSWFVPLALLLVLGILIVTGILLRGLRQQHPQITLPEMPSLPRVFDGACLTWLMYAGAATPVASAFYGHLDTAWG